MKKIIKTILAWTWCFPQELLGLIVRVVTKAQKQDGGYYIYNVKSGSVSLGTYIMLCRAQSNSDTVLKHEQGHTKQSFILGWLFLVVIGLPSIIWAGCFDGYRLKHGVSYYTFYTERWADKLGGVVR